MSYLPLVAIVLAALFLLAAAARFHKLTGTWASGALCVLAPIAVLYQPISLWLFGHVMNDWLAWMSNWLLWFAADMLPSLLVVAASAVFFAAVRQLGRPNQSFGSTSLRDPA